MDPFCARHPLGTCSCKQARCPWGPVVSLECPDQARSVLLACLGPQSLTPLAMQLLNFSQERAGAAGGAHVVALQSGWEALCLGYLGCSDFCSPNCSVKAHSPIPALCYTLEQPHAYTTTSICYAVRRGRSPTIMLYLGTAKGEIRKGLAAQRQLPRGRCPYQGWWPPGPWGWSGAFPLPHVTPRTPSQSTAMAPGPWASQGWDRPWVGQTPPLPR